MPSAPEPVIAAPKHIPELHRHKLQLRISRRRCPGKSDKDLPRFVTLAKIPVEQDDAFLDASLRYATRQPPCEGPRANDFPAIRRALGLHSQTHESLELSVR